ncbi:hypothetical protein V8C35DRAFT_280293 [Trichoderma chlorosporum]
MISSIVSALLLLPAAFAAPAAKVDAAPGNLAKRYCSTEPGLPIDNPPPITPEDIQGLISDINALGSWDTLVPLDKTGGTCMGEAAWVTNYIAFDQCPTEAAGGSFFGGDATCHGDDGLSLSAHLTWADFGCLFS